MKKKTQEGPLPGVAAQLVYTGVIELVKGGLGHKYRFWENEELGQNFIVKKRLQGSERPGAILKVQVSENRETVYGRGLEFAGYFPDREKATVWAAESRAVEDNKKAAALEKKKLAKDEVEEAVAPLRAVFLKVSPASRAQFLARIVYLLTK